MCRLPFLQKKMAEFCLHPNTFSYITKTSPEAFPKSGGDLGFGWVLVGGGLGLNWVYVGSWLGGLARIWE